MKRKYVLHPGHTTSKSDGQSHYISAARLADLYGVSLRDCISASTPEYMADHREYLSATHLYPRYSGNYQLPGGAA